MYLIIKRIFEETFVKLVRDSDEFSAVRFLIYLNDLKLGLISFQNPPSKILEITLEYSMTLL